MVENTEKNEGMNPIKKAILILLTIFILGPLIFIGTCISMGVAGMLGIGFFGLENILNDSEFLFYLLIGICALLAIYIVVKTIKAINER